MTEATAARPGLWLAAARALTTGCLGATSDDPEDAGAAVRDAAPPSPFVVDSHTAPAEGEVPERWCLSEAPACRRAINFVADDIGRACTAEEAMAPLGQAVAVSVNGRAQGPEAYRVEPDAACPGGVALWLTDAPMAGATIIVRYVPAEG